MTDLTKPVKRVSRVLSHEVNWQLVFFSKTLGPESYKGKERKKAKQKRIRRK